VLCLVQCVMESSSICYVRMPLVTEHNSVTCCCSVNEGHVLLLVACSLWCVMAVESSRTNGQRAYSQFC
jgi:hypothetical protein